MLDKVLAYLVANEPHADSPGDKLWDDAMDEVKALRALPGIVLLAGSSRFKHVFELEAERLALSGNIVLGKHIFKPGDQWPLDEYQKDLIHAIQFRMCDLAARLHVLNVDGYIGQDTYNLIRYAMRIDVPITFYEGEVRLLSREGATVTTHHFLQATRRRVEFEEAAVS